MDREESLGKRFLNYLGLEYEFQKSFEHSGATRGIAVFPPCGKAGVRLRIFYNSWHNLLFGCPGHFGFRDLRKWFCDNGSPWFEYKLKAFQFENLDELEMQLAARGF